MRKHHNTVQGRLAAALDSALRREVTFAEFGALLLDKSRAFAMLDQWESEGFDMEAARSALVHYWMQGRSS